MKEFIVKVESDEKSIIIDAKSGVSGAGRSPVLNSLFAEANEGVKPYKIGTHQHTPEIEQELGLIAKQQVSLLFTPHLMPMNRGILVTAYATPKTMVAQKDLLNIYNTFYQNDRFVRMCPPETVPSTHQVKGSNYCDIGIIVDPKTKRLIFIAAIDNLLKGASGQAIQNMNMMAGLEEDSASSPFSPNLTACACSAAISARASSLVVIRPSRSASLMSAKSLPISFPGPRCNVFIISFPVKSGFSTPCGVSRK